MSDFVECDTCRAKPGTPPLCSGCLANRETIERLNMKKCPQVEIIDQKEEIELLKAYIRHLLDVIKELEEESDK